MTDDQERPRECNSDCLWALDRLPPNYTPFLKCLGCDKRSFHAEPIAADNSGELALLRQQAVKRRWLDYTGWAP